MTISSLVKNFAKKYAFTRKFSKEIDSLILQLLPRAQNIKDCDYIWDKTQYGTVIQVRTSEYELPGNVWQFRASHIKNADILICLGVTKSDIYIWCLHKKEIKNKFLRLKKGDRHFVEPEYLEDTIIGLSDKYGLSKV